MSLSKLAKLSPKTTALFICDVQERFRDIIWQFPTVLSVGNKMIKASKILGVPAIVTEQYPKAFGPTASELDISEAALCVQKTKFSMLVPEVQDALKKHGTQSIVLLGIESHVCVLQTALELLENQYDVHVLADGVSSQNEGEISIALGRMKAAGATITTSDSILFQLLKDAKHENFKAISGLIKEYSEATRVNQLLQRAANAHL